MWLARVLSAFDQSDPKISALVAAEELDLLQLDYVWQGAPQRFAPGFLEQMQTLQKAFFLDPACT